jgi:ribosomal-protein-alanine acetyltransferase
MTGTPPTGRVPVGLRPLARADLDDVHRLEVASSPDPWGLDLLAGEVEGDRGDRHWLVATEPTSPSGPTDPAIVGFGGILQAVDEAHVMNLVVDRAQRRRGVASRLLAALLLTMGDRGARSATLEVRAANAGAIGLYRRFGFERAGRRPRYYADGEDAEIMWCHRIDWPDRRNRFRAMGAFDG